MRIEKSTVKRYLVFAIAVVMLFAIMFVKLHNLQVVNADQYQQSVMTSSFKTIRLTGKRGMITDAESVVLAMSEDIYNVTFLLTISQLSESYYKEITPSILRTKEIVESFGGKLKNEFVIQRNPETTLLEFNFGSGISEKALAIRESQWRGRY